MRQTAVLDDRDAAESDVRPGAGRRVPRSGRHKAVTHTEQLANGTTPLRLLRTYNRLYLQGEDFHAPVTDRGCVVRVLCRCSTRSPGFRPDAAADDTG